jgi:hypothetical protein
MVNELGRSCNIFQRKPSRRAGFVMPRRNAFGDATIVIKQKAPE